MLHMEKFCQAINTQSHCRDVLAAAAALANGLVANAPTSVKEAAADIFGLGPDRRFPIEDWPRFAAAMRAAGLPAADADALDAAAAGVVRANRDLEAAWAAIDELCDGKPAAATAH